MNTNEVNERIASVIGEVATQQNISIPGIDDNHEFVDDLGFSSLAVAALIANLEEVLGVDPFTNEDVMITDVRTVGDLCQVYCDFLAH